MATTWPWNMPVSLARRPWRSSCVYRCATGRPTCSHSHQPVPVPRLVVYEHSARGKREVRPSGATSGTGAAVSTSTPTSSSWSITYRAAVGTSSAPRCVSSMRCWTGRHSSTSQAYPQASSSSSALTMLTASESPIWNDVQCQPHTHQAPVLHRGLAHALRPQTVGAHLERVAAGKRDFVVAHHDEAVLGRHEVRPIPGRLLVGIETEADVPARAVGAREVEVPRLVPVRARPRLMAAMRRYSCRCASFTLAVIPSSSSSPTGASVPPSVVNTPAADSRAK